MVKIYRTKEDVLDKARSILRKSFRDVIGEKIVELLEVQIGEYKMRRKGLLGELIEKYFFEINPGNLSKPDFQIPGIELKVTPLKRHAKNSFVSKERLVFSMINYDSIVSETWESSSFLQKNKNLLLMFYLWLQNQNILDYEFKFIHFLSLLDDISDEDTFQIQKDWEFIVDKIRRGEAHLLSEADTYYLGACTKAANSRVVRDQPMNRIPAKPRAFSFKQQYINYLIQTKLLGKSARTDSIFKKERRLKTIEEKVKEKFYPFIGKSDREILDRLGSSLGKGSKSYKRLIVNRILGVETNEIQELEKANITLKVITLEKTGTLRESISFPAFDYKDLLKQSWQDEESETMADFHIQLETKKFLFVVFQKQYSDDTIVLKKIMFWNFPMEDIEEAHRVWREAVRCIKDGDYKALPKMSQSTVAHVRPHGKNSRDTIETPQGTWEVKRCFWLNAHYIQGMIESGINKA